MKMIEWNEANDLVYHAFLSVFFAQKKEKW